MPDGGESICLTAADTPEMDGLPNAKEIFG